MFDINGKRRAQHSLGNGFLVLALLLIVLLHSTPVEAQLPDQWLGTWSGTMYIYKQKVVIDSVPVRLAIAPTSRPQVLSWKTEYLSEKRLVHRRLKEKRHREIGNGIEKTCQD